MLSFVLNCWRSSRGETLALSEYLQIIWVVYSHSLSLVFVASYVCSCLCYISSDNIYHEITQIVSSFSVQKNSLHVFIDYYHWCPISSFSPFSCIKIKYYQVSGTNGLYYTWKHFKCLSLSQKPFYSNSLLEFGMYIELFIHSIIHLCPMYNSMFSVT